ncbi:hypothetical protein [Vibrio mangrovi]|uniref:Uncharacterized protein n=1 Tax=Vibrio mangrovi TaxID=474394 RepID=A0A1Y6INJ6_9VIBR|nr:hypothetical protein [Vibrio mangrovi]MDW6003995.1 hypothetical protein [Vibrio mangrovi]SMR99208.1 hypothetical protein VIM7927_00432 [Vibrio mangrovi]
MLEGFYRRESDVIRYWVRDEHSDDEANSIRELKSLLDSLDLTTVFNLQNLTLQVSQKSYFNYVYRGDFAHNDGHKSTYDTNLNKWTTTLDGKILANQNDQFERAPESVSGCDIVLTVRVPEAHIRNKWSNGTKLLLGLDPFAAFEGKEFGLSQSWSNNHMTGKSMSASALTQYESPFKDCTKLYAGLLHGIGGAPLHKKELDDWLEAMKHKFGSPSEPFVLLAPSLTIGSMGRVVPQWMGIFRDDSGEERLSWIPLSDLAELDEFWDAMCATGKAHEDDFSTGNLFGDDEW